MINNDGNILLRQIIVDISSFIFLEVIPSYTYTDTKQVLTRKDKKIFWSELDASLNLIVNNRFKDIEVYYDDGRIGIGRFPLHTYRVDLAIPKDTQMTAFHIGDGTFGFSMGNGASKGYIPEIIGIGSGENEPGLYFVAIPGNDKASNIPLIVLDGRSAYNDKLTNRPIFGVTSANFNDYSVTVDSLDNLNVKGNISTTDLIINNISLIEIIQELQEQIDSLKNKIENI
jgi:hypothetical protein